MVPVVRVPRVLRGEAGARACLRWSLAIGFVVGTALWVHGYGRDGLQFGAVSVGFLLWALWGLLGCVARWTARAPRARRSAGWGTLLWLTIPVWFLLFVWAALDARLWFAWHRDALERLRAAAADEASPFPGRRVERLADGTLVVVAGGFWLSARGVAFDPLRVLTCGERWSVTAGRITNLTDLSGGWRAWWVDD